MRIDAMAAAFAGIAATLLISIAPAARADSATAVNKDGEANQIVLSASMATIVGKNARKITNKEGVTSIEYWDNVNTSLEWYFDIPANAEYRVELNCAVNSDDVKIVLTIGSNAIPFTLEAVKTGAFNYAVANIGNVTLNRDKKLDVKATLKCVEKPGSYVMNLREIRLVPTPEL